MRRTCGTLLIAVASALALCRCGSTSFSSSVGADSGPEAAADSPADNVIVVHSDSGDTNEGGVDADAGEVKDAPTETAVSCDAATTVVCNGTCIDKETDPHNCNGCGNVCPGPDSGTGKGICINAACQISCESDSGTTLFCPLTGQCVDPTGVANCGQCGNACTPPPSNGSATCSGSPLACGVSCTGPYHPAGTGCNTTCLANGDDPSGDPCVVADGLGVFVSPAGNDASPGDGSKEHPFGTIDHAMVVAAAGSKRVYACGTFTAANQAVNAPSTVDGVSVFGGFDCSSWAYSATTPTKVAPTTAGYALEVDGTTTGITFEDFEFDAVSAPGTPSATPASSIAVFANGATLTLTRVTVNAGSGQPGSGGTTSTNWSGTNTKVGRSSRRYWWRRRGRYVELLH